MKNKILIDFDTERENPIQLSKDEGVVKNLSEDDTKKMILEDMTAVCNALGTLIQIGGDSGYFEPKKLSDMCIDYLNENFNNIETKEEDPEETLS